MAARPPDRRVNTNRYPSVLILFFSAVLLPFCYRLYHRFWGNVRTERELSVTHTVYIVLYAKSDYFSYVKGYCNATDAHVPSMFCRFLNCG